MPATGSRAGADALNHTFAALADPTRRAILARLAHGEASVTELAAPFAVSLPAITKHLKVLERAGLVSRGRQAQWRPVRLEGRPLAEAADWIAQYRAFWESRLDRLERYLATMDDAPSSPSPAAPASAATASAAPSRTTARAAPAPTAKKRRRP